MKPELKWEVTYTHPPAKVWQALTDPAALEEWLQPEEDVLHYGIIEAVEMRSVSYSWTTRDCDAIVTFELRPAEVGTTVRLKMDERKTAAAWAPLALDSLRSYLERAVADASGHLLVFTNQAVSLKERPTTEPRP